MTAELIVKEVDFNGDVLMAVQAQVDGKVYVGVNWVCDGIGLDKSGKDTQVKKVQSDIVLSQGCVKFGAGAFDPHNNTVAIELDFLPLWLAKISITPAMQKSHPEVVNKLVNYQLLAQKVLAQAFIEKSITTVPQNYKEAVQHLLTSIEENEKLKLENDTMKPKADFHDDVSKAENSDSIMSVAKNFGIGKSKFFQLLRSVGVLFVHDNYNMPKQLYQNAGYFEVSLEIDDESNTSKTVHRTRVTGKGKVYLHKLVTMYGGSEAINSLLISDIDGYVNKMDKEAEEKQLETIK